MRVLYCPTQTLIGLCIFVIFVALLQRREAQRSAVEIEVQRLAVLEAQDVEANVSSNNNSLKITIIHVLLTQLQLSKVTPIS